MKFEDTSQNLRARLRFVQVLVVVLLGALSVRLYVLQVVRCKLSIPVTTPVIELKPDRVATFDGWNALGNDIYIHVEDARFPNGMDLSSRMIGWELSPANADQVETLKISIQDNTEGGDGGV